MNKKIVEIIPVLGLPEFKKNDDLLKILKDALKVNKLNLVEGDVLIITQKIISKIEDMIVDLKDIDINKLLENESTQILRKRGETIISRTKHGFISDFIPIESKDNQLVLSSF